MSSNPLEPGDEHKMLDAFGTTLNTPPPAGVCRYRYTFSSLDQMYCERKLLVGSEYCYWHAKTFEKYTPSAVESYFGPGKTLIRAVEDEITSGRTLAGAYLVGAAIGGNGVHAGSVLDSGYFVQADLSRARMSYSNLRRCNFAYANLDGAFLSDCDLTGCNFSGARLFKTKFRNNTFDHVRGLQRRSFRGLKWGWYPAYHMLEDYPEQCGPVYRSLASHFANSGLFDDASWAAYRSAVMQHRLLTKGLKPLNVMLDEALDHALLPSAKPQFTKGKFAAMWAVALLRWLRSLILLVVAGYGEKPSRVALNAAAVIFGYACMYHAFGAITDSTWSASLYFSIITFSTVGYGEITPKVPFRLLAGSEGLLGMVLTGLFLFALGRRSMARA